MGFTDVLKKAYPFLTAAASFVPGGNIATTAIGQILNLKSGASLDDAGIALMNATPEQRAQLQAEDNRHKEVITQMGFASAEEFEKIAAEDRASARTREMTIRDRLPAILAMFITCGFFSVLFLAFTRGVNEQSRDLLNIMIGTLGTAWVSVVSYYFGSSAGSAAKTELLAKSQPIEN